MKKDNDSNSDSDDSDSDTHIPYLFSSALNVGTHFIDLVPDNELIFYNYQGTLYTRFQIKNTTQDAPVAFFVGSDSANCLPRSGPQLRIRSR